MERILDIVKQITGQTKQVIDHKQQATIQAYQELMVTAFFLLLSILLISYILKSKKK